MLKFVQDKKDKRKWAIIELGEDSTFKNQIINLELIPSSLTNKFTIVTNLIEELSETMEEFEPWFKGLIKTYTENAYDSSIIFDNIATFIEISEKYIDSKDIEFSSFSRSDKSSKTSILFTADDIRTIAISSTALKLYAIFAYDLTLKLPENIHKQAYEKLIQSCIDKEITTKIFHLVKSRIYRSSITDRYMWDLIWVSVLETPETYVMTIFNFIMSNIISTIAPERNPIPFIVSIVDDSIRWMMRSVYKDRVLYGEAFGGSDDIYGSSISKDSFQVICCNDVIGKAASIGMDLLENEYKLEQKDYEGIRDRLDSVDLLYPNMKLIILPIVSKVLEIPYKYLLTCPPKHALLCGVFMSHLAKGVLDTKYPIIYEFLLSTPKTMSTVSTRSSYKIKKLDNVINRDARIFGFSAKKLKFDIMSSLCGVSNSSKRNLVSLITGDTISKIGCFDLEADVISFFSDLYSDGLEEEIKEMRRKADGYF